jgi:bifunctional non-homologous end joining protein LigD
LKCHQEQELVIGGFTLPSNGSVGIGALLLGYYEGTNLRYAGRSGTGFTQATHRTLRAQLDRIERKDSPFAEVPREDRRGAHWVKPELVAQISFSNWTRDNLVRQAAFKGLREDKPAKEVLREMAISDSSESQTALKTKNATAIAHHRSIPESKTSRLAITHPEKVLDAESGMTKQALADYYVAVADHLLPHIADRPLSVVRCPDGNGKPCFFQKHIGLGLPTGVKSISIKSRKRDSSDDYLMVDSSEGLVGLAQMGVLEIHPWGSRNGSLEQPDRIVFDLDPDVAISWKTIAATAIEFRKRLKKLGLVSYVKTTGGKGLHVVVPIRPDHEWPAIKEFAHQIVLEMERDKPNLYVTKMTKATRKNRIYLDYLRNDREATSVAPFSPRARGGAPVSMPLAWSELDTSKAPVFRVSDFADWQVRLRRDPWRELLENEQVLGNVALRKK